MFPGLLVNERCYNTAVNDVKRPDTGIDIVFLVLWIRILILIGN